MIPAVRRMCESGWMRKGIEVRLGPGDRERLEAVIGSGNSSQKHVWRPRIVLLSADGVGTMAIRRQTGKANPTIWDGEKIAVRLNEDVISFSGNKFLSGENIKVCTKYSGIYFDSAG